LLNEGKKSESVVVTGNTAIDAMKYTVDEDYKSNIIDQYRDKKFILMTAHRRENIGKPMENIFKAVKRLVDENTDLALVYPMH
ncbi:UDP-N-acetylglucosamine 2-epimerase, partial [Staphylococcus argenteus]|nr:UDP-N-acetylglucosamine 2-epimerase [Staphylococcus argenteus]